VGIDLIVQYIAGLGANVYAPASGFTMNTDFGIYDVHWLNGYVVGVLSIVLVVVAVLSRQTRTIVSSSVSFVAVLVSAVAGMAFVNSTPNPASASLVMGVAFLVAFSTVMALMFQLRRSDGPSTPTTTAPA